MIYTLHLFKILLIIALFVPLGTISIAEDTAISQDSLKSGKELYLKRCRLCHGSKGTSGKRLSKNQNLADTQYVANTIINGRGYMTAFGEHLTDEEISLIMTFVRNSIGNSFGAVSAEEVARYR
ncbi:cytochrome c [Paracoccaceae bacterium]|jgi:mono/diheme cytochrome c family protein|nr:cytochrome c [Paracoccaceae bacterium]